jgi:uncharacterized protein
MSTLTHAAGPKPMVTRDVQFVFSRDGMGDMAPEDEGNTIVGHALVFGQETEIDSWEGQFIEACMPGCTKKSIRERVPVMQFEHGKHPLVGSIPIGVIDEIREDDIGLFIRGTFLDTWLIEPVKEAIANRSVTGMSFRFEVIRDRWFDSAGKSLTVAEVQQLLWEPGDRGPLRRELVEIKIPELGPVVFAAYKGTDVSVRAREVAHEIATDPALVRKVRAMLATRSAATGFDTTRDVSPVDLARAILFPARSETEPEPVDDDEPLDDDDESASLLDDTAPLDELEHPVTDAPPDVAPVDSPLDQDERARYARLSYVTRERVGKLVANHGRYSHSSEQADQAS